MNLSARKNNKEAIISHGTENESLVQAIKSAKERIRQKGDLPYVSVREQLEIVDRLSEFPLGKFLLQNKGLNGYWTDYVVHYPYKEKLSGVDSTGRPLTGFEKMLLETKALLTMTQQRAVIFKQNIQRHIKDGACLCSVPCGLMRDLLALDFTRYRDFQLTGIDLDVHALEGARKLAQEYNLSERVEFFQYDAWNLQFEDKFTLLTSNGLNIYEPDDNRVIALYGQFFKTLIPDGILVTSFMNSENGWKIALADEKYLLKRKIIFFDVLGVKWGYARTIETTKLQLESVGFRNIEFYFDEMHMFPTAIAQK